MVCTLDKVKSSLTRLNDNYTLFVPNNPDETSGKLFVVRDNYKVSFEADTSSDFIVISPLDVLLFSNLIFPVIVWLVEFIISANWI